MRVLVSCPEPSAALLAAVIERDLADRVPGLSVVRLPAADPTFGFWEGVKAAYRGRRWVLAAERLARARAPDVALLVGMPGLNLPLGSRLRRSGVPVVMVAPPQVWVWGRWRVRAVRRAADLVVCFLPFEQPLWSAAGVDAVFVGNPLLDLLADAAVRPGATGDERLLLLPGSRPAELDFHRPLFLDCAAELVRSRPGLEFREVLAPVDPQPGRQLADANRRYRLMAGSSAALAASGTVTLELALLGVPMVACYHLSRPTRLAARLLVRTRHFALPNILLGNGDVPELLEPSLRELAAAAGRLLDDPAALELAAERAERLRRQLGPPGAGRRIARLVEKLASRGAA
ncbi:hypothetical protein JXB37_00420 [candidate division WOR-3 bacterium]|nr:hypothetical protein [candidate division WOR-3 bacterium]